MEAESLKLIEQEFSSLKSLYFNSAYLGPSPRRAKERATQALQVESDPSFLPYSAWKSVPETIRQKIAQLIGCSGKSVALTTSTTDLISLVANGYPWQKGDQICAIHGDYPSNILPWMRAQEKRNFELNLLKLEEGQQVPAAEWVAQHLPSQCKIFNISWVAFETGKRVDIEAIGKICQERGIFFVVDATQALGGMNITPEQLKQIDVLTCSTYKWMLGPYGTAFAYFSPQAIDKIHPYNGNWLTARYSNEVQKLLNYTVETLEGACKFDRGQAPNMLANASLMGSLELLQEIGLSRIQAHNQELSSYFLEHYPREKFKLITPREPEHRANIVCLEMKQGNPFDLEEKLKRENIDISVRQGNLRLSFHLFNNKDQVNKLMETLES